MPFRVVRAGTMMLTLGQREEARPAASSCQSRWEVPVEARLPDTRLLMTVYH